MACAAEHDVHGNSFETSALLITFICLGKYLESAAKGKTSQVHARTQRRLRTSRALCHVMSNLGPALNRKLKLS